MHEQFFILPTMYGGRERQLSGRFAKPLFWCPEGDLNPHDRLGSADFKSAVSADFTIRACSGKTAAALSIVTYSGHPSHKEPFSRRTRISLCLQDSETYAPH